MISRPVKAKNYNDVYPMGGPDAYPLSLVIEAQKVFDWRDPGQDPYDPDTWTYSDNAALCTAHYYMVRAYKDWDTHFAPTIDFWTAAADDCDVAMDLKGGGTEPRYRVALAHKHTDAHKVTIGNLLAAWDGFVAPRSDGALVPWSGRYVEPDTDDMIGADEIVSYSWDYGIVDEDQFNEIAISYLSADHDYTTVDATSWIDLDAVSEAGELKTTTLENAVPSHAQARRLAKRLMSKVMAPNRGSVTTNARGRKIRGKRFIPLHIEEAGAVFFSGTAEIVRLRRNLSTGGVTFDWVKADPNIDAWDPETEEGEPAPVGTRVALAPLVTPEISDSAAVLSSDGSNALILIDVDVPDRDDLTWYGRWKQATDSVWNEQEYTDIDASALVTLLIGLVPSNASIDVAAAYQVGDGRVSEWSATVTVSTATASLAPVPNTAFTATGAAGSVSGSWANSISSNFGHSELWSGPTTDFGDAGQLGSDYTGTAGVTETFSETLTAGTYYLWTVAYNAADTASSRTGPIEVTVT